MTTSNSTSQNRPKSHRAEIVAAAAHVTIAVLACLGIYTFYHSFIAEEKQNAEQKIQNAEESIARLYPLDLNINLNQALVEYPNVRLCLRNDPQGKNYKSLGSQDKAVLEDAIEAYGDLFEYYVLIRDRIKYHPHGDEIIRSWDAYLEDICKNSYGFREQINSTQKTWTKMFMDEFKRHAPTLGPESSPSAETPARQSPPKP